MASLSASQPQPPPAKRCPLVFSVCLAVGCFCDSGDGWLMEKRCGDFQGRDSRLSPKTPANYQLQPAACRNQAEGGQTGRRGDPRRAVSAGTCPAAPGTQAWLCGGLSDGHGEQATLPTGSLAPVSASVITHPFPVLKFRGMRIGGRTQFHPGYPQCLPFRDSPALLAQGAPPMCPHTCSQGLVPCGL